MPDGPLVSNLNEPKLVDIFILREWIPFSDQEISIFQLYSLYYFL